MEYFRWKSVSFRVEIFLPIRWFFLCILRHTVYSSINGEYWRAILQSTKKNWTNKSPLNEKLTAHLSSIAKMRIEGETQLKKQNWKAKQLIFYYSQSHSADSHLCNWMVNNSRRKKTVTRKKKWENTFRVEHCQKQKKKLSELSKKK